MDMNSFFGKSKLLHSAKATEGAAHLLEKIEREQLMMDVLPNNYDRFTGDMEEHDHLSYCRFLNSVNGKNVLTMLEEEDARNVIQL